MSKKNFTFTGEPYLTIKHTCDDAVETLVDDVTGFLAQINGANVVGVLITCEDNDIRFAWGANPAQNGLGHILYVAQSIKLTNHKQIIDFRFINKTNAADAVIMITAERSGA